jgi:proteic killer suppression protein
MIRSSKDSEAAKIYALRRSKKLPADIQQIALRKMRMLNNAVTLNDLRIPPANRLEKLSGNRVGQHSTRTNDQWRLGFEWRDGDAYAVDIVDYH